MIFTCINVDTTRDLQVHVQVIILRFLLFLFRCMTVWIYYVGKVFYNYSLFIDSKCYIHDVYNAAAYTVLHTPRRRSIEQVLLFKHIYVRLVNPSRKTT